MEGSMVDAGADCSDGCVQSVILLMKWRMIRGKLPWRAILESMGRMPVAFDPYGMILFAHFISKI